MKFEIAAPNTLGVISLEQKVQMLEDYCHRLRKELLHFIENIDENNFSSIIKIKAAQIGSVYAESVVADTTLINVNMSVGSGNNIFKVDKQGIYLGNSRFENAPFSVDMKGNLYATNAYIEGTIASSEIIGGEIIGGSISGGIINGVSITGSTITGGSITSNTTINVTTNATIGNNLYIGEALTTGKKIIFNSNASISNPSGTENLTVSAFGYLNLEGGYGVRINGSPVATQSDVYSAIAAHEAAYHS